MNQLTRQFLPSQVRGVYRFDEIFEEQDEKSYQIFFENKLRFLPCSLKDPIVKSFQNLTVDFRSTKSQLQLKELIQCSPRTVKQRYDKYFQTHTYFQNALTGNINGSDNYLEINFVRKILAPLLNDKGMASIYPQKRIGKYYADFALESQESKIVIEIDGFGKFKDRENLDDFIERQNYITCQGWKVIRFTYGQIVNTTEATIKKLHDFLNTSPHFRQFLSTSSQGNLFESAATDKSTNINVLDLVNNFFKIQDWFVDYVLRNKEPKTRYLLKDNFNYKFPIVALSLSALYKFLDAVSGVVEINFDLPIVKIEASISNFWRHHLHPYISCTGKPKSSAEIIDSITIQNIFISVPIPCQRGEIISFRKGLEVEDIKQRLEYISCEIFGYKDGTNRFQDKVLQRVFNGKETLGISTTGSGKSFCFWLPSLLKPGLTLVISPLRSLMRDQRLTLQNYGINSMEFINSDVNAADQRRFMEEAKYGYLRLLYISPERLRIRKFVEELDLLQQFTPINVLAIDEAHCISEWGHDFRPSYLKIPSIRIDIANRNPNIRLIALTATAGKLVERDMRGILKLDETDVIREPVADRERFSYQIIPIEEGNSKTNAFHSILTTDLPKALKQEQRSLQGLLSQYNTRNEKAVGIIFCIYADPHGKNTVIDGTSHYLFETMKIIEPNNIFQSRRGNYPKYNIDAFSSGKVRAFASKPPTLCPNCFSYNYTSQNKARNAPPNIEDEDVEASDVEINITSPAISGHKICYRCNKLFPASDVWIPKKENWEKIIKINQIDFKESALDILVATKGFGMGIDKSSVRFVIHTSLSSGIESWYQEIGRAGRDNERSHIVLLVETPNEKCRQDLEKMPGAKRPLCSSWQGGCKHGKKSICDYGKQHLFIAKSYPGAEYDSLSSLRMLDKLFFVHEQTQENPISIRFNYNDDISRSELALYRLLTLGLIEDYTVVYGGRPCFEVLFCMEDIPDSAEELEFVENHMKSKLLEHMTHWEEAKGNPIDLKSIQDYLPLESFRVKTNTYNIFSKLTPLFHQYQYSFFKTVYEHLLLLLDHTYKDVVKMRYDMLWNLLNVSRLHDKKCLRTKILPYFEGDNSVADTYRCECCNVCSPELAFLEYVHQRPKNPSVESSERELIDLLNRNILDINKLRRLCAVFSDYRTAKYIQGRAILEGDPNNLPALYITREFSPPSELEANTKRLIQTANVGNIPLSQLIDLYKTSEPQFKPDLLLILNQEKTTCDTTAGWEFLAFSAANLDHYNEKAEDLLDCLEFFLMVEAMPLDTKTYHVKAKRLMEIFNA